MNKVIALFSGLMCISLQTFAAPVPKPYIPDESASTVAPKTTNTAKSASGITSLTQQRLAKKTTSTEKKVVTAKAQPKAETKPVKVALNTTQRIKRTAKNPVPQKQTVAKTNRIASRAESASQSKVIAPPAALNTAAANHKLSLLSGGPRLDSSSALVMNASTGRMVYGKNAAKRVPIASITKLMTAMVVLDASLPMDKPITISNADIDRVKKSSSRLEIGTTLSRHDVMWLALMSSENRAAHALARTYPGGEGAFVKAMNKKAKALGMRSTIFYDPTGLNKNNTSTAADLALMVQAAYRYNQIREFTTSTDHDIVSASGRQLHYKNSNALVREGIWDIELSKTGYIKEAGRCLVMVADVKNKPMVMVFLAANGPSGRINDAKNLKNWLENQPTNQLG